MGVMFSVKNLIREKLIKSSTNLSFSLIKAIMNDHCINAFILLDGGLAASSSNFVASNNLLANLASSKLMFSVL